MIVFIVNIITALMAMLGGFIMKRSAKPDADRSIGFRTSRALASVEAWCFSNRKCGRYWLKTGASALAFSAAAFIVLGNSFAGSVLQVILLVLQTAGLLIAALAVEKQLKYRYDGKDE